MKTVPAAARIARALERCGAAWWSLARALRAHRGLLTVQLGSEPLLVLQIDGQERRVALGPGSVRAWTVGNGGYGPFCLQLAAGESAESGVALCIVPRMRQWALADGASWLRAYTGWSPVARGPELLDLLAPFTVPANADWRAA